MHLRALRGSLRHLAWIAALAVGLAGARVDAGAESIAQAGTLAPVELSAGLAEACAQPQPETRFATPVPGLTGGVARRAGPAGPALGAGLLDDRALACLSRRHLECVRARPPPVPHA